MPRVLQDAVKTLLRLALPAVLLICASCGRQEKPSPAAPARRYALKGVIEAVDATRPSVTVVHERVPGFMDAMTMAFPVHDDPRVVAILRARDKIEATLVVDGDRYWLGRILTNGFLTTPTPRLASPTPPAGAPGPLPQPPAPRAGSFSDF